MTRSSRQVVIWAVLALFAITWSGVVVACWADDGGPASNPGDPENYPSTCRIDGSSVGTFECSEQTLEPTPGILSDFWMILMAMAFQLAL
jgi:hypothetical protein